MSGSNNDISLDEIEKDMNIPESVEVKSYEIFERVMDEYGIYRKQLQGAYRDMKEVEEFLNSNKEKWTLGFYSIQPVY